MGQLFHFLHRLNKLLLHISDLLKTTLSDQSDFIRFYLIKFQYTEGLTDIYSSDVSLESIGHQSETLLKLGTHEMLFFKDALTLNEIEGVTLEGVETALEPQALARFKSA